MDRLTVLLTGFEPFGGEARNPSAEVVAQLQGQTWSGGQGRGWQARVQGVVLPCVFDAARQMLRQRLTQARPQLVVCLGQAGGRAAIGVERFAINWVDARIPDNAGQQPVDRPVVPGAPLARMTRLPAKALVGALRRAGHPAELSLSAGSFVCNAVFYELLQALVRRPSVQAGFVHLPWLPEQRPEDRPEAQAMPLAEQVGAVRLLLQTALDWRGRPDEHSLEGRLD